MTASRARCYALFHLNLAYSSIEVTQRPKVIERCYWPLLELVRATRLRPGIELSGYTLSAIQGIAPEWVAQLRALLQEDRCELIGSGYSQIIGPLVPADVNAINLRLGNEAYSMYLGGSPRIALVNEQAYSSGLVPLYREAGYQAIAMEWNNPAARHPEWSRALRDAPQRALGADGSALPLLWIDTIAFQQLQRLAHGELEQNDYLAYLERALREASTAEIALPLYGNDAEIFDYRPARFTTEAAIDPRGEWRRIANVLGALERDERFAFVTPSEALACTANAAIALRLESAEEPIPVKKQEKYNVTRWAVTGRNDLAINTECWRLLRALRAKSSPDPQLERALCSFWASDYRTHITEARWRELRAELAKALAQHAEGSRQIVRESVTPLGGDSGQCSGREPLRRRGRLLDVETAQVRVTLDLGRGATVRSLAFASLGPAPLIGTIPHGFFDDLALAADFYTGHTVIEFPGASRVTDLAPVEASGQRVRGELGEAIRITAVVHTSLGAVGKTIDVFEDAPRIRIRLDFDCDLPRRGTFRTGFVTALPTAFARERLFFRTHNGGRDAETFLLAGRHVRHGAAVSSLVSARSGLGATEGRVSFGDHERCIAIRFDPAEVAALPLLEYRDVGDSYWLRLAFSLAEIDETRGLPDLDDRPMPAPSFCFEIAAEQT